MSKTVTICIAGLALVLSAWGNPEPADKDTRISLGYGRYELSGLRYEQVYQEGREIYSLEVFQPFQIYERHIFGLAAGLRSFTKKGRSTLTQDPTKLSIHPLSLSVRYMLDFGFLQPWAELGTGLYSYREESTLQTSEGTCLGYHIQGGLLLGLREPDFLRIQLSLRHSRAIAEQNGIRANLGGFEYGISLVFVIDIL